MFWPSVLQGFKNFFNLHLLLALLPLLLYQILLHSILLWTTRLKESQDAVAPGCLVQIIGTLFHGFFLGVWVLWVIPALFGKHVLLSLDQMIPVVWLATRAGILAAIAVHLLAMFPILGSIIGNSPGLEAFIIGATVFRITAPQLIPKLFSPRILAGEIFPLWQQWLLLSIVVFLLSKFLFIFCRRLPGLNRWTPTRFFLLYSSIDQLSAVLGFLILGAFISARLG